MIAMLEAKVSLCTECELTCSWRALSPAFRFAAPENCSQVKGQPDLDQFHMVQICGGTSVTVFYQCNRAEGGKAVPLSLRSAVPKTNEVECYVIDCQVSMLSLAAQPSLNALSITYALHGTLLNLP